jgi:hypothetical protein
MLDQQLGIPTMDLQTILFNPALVLLTAGLVWYTLKLAEHTKALSSLTGQLVLIEKEREHRTQQEQRRETIKNALMLIEDVRRVDEQAFTSEFKQGQYSGAKLIKQLALLIPLFDNPECVGRIKDLRKLLDVEPRFLEEGFVQQNLIRLKGDLGEYVIRWREELDRSQTIG